ncbi:MAG: cysteine hydrolase family protein [Terriglobales bacterium]
MHSDFNSAVLIVIDVQQAFNHPRWGTRNNLGAEGNIAKLLSAWRKTKRPIIHIHHSNPNPKSLFNGNGLGVKPEAKPLNDEPVLFKSVNSGFIGTDLEERLKSMKVKKLVLVGITTDHCVSTTARMAGNYGFDTYVVSDATATFERTRPNGRHYTPEEMHDSALTSLNGEFASIVNTSDLMRQ